MRKVIISDTSCLIQLEPIGELELLYKLFGAITVTPEIVDEFHGQLPAWIIVESVSNKTYQTILGASLDIGEASAIALAIEQSECLLIIDDLKGRKFAEKFGLTITGTLGISSMLN
jgi:predicted nucleic acid-binding protein